MNGPFRMEVNVRNWWKFYCKKKKEKKKELKKDGDDIRK